MTTTDASLAEVFRALFPAASITGAPKRRKNSSNGDPGGTWGDAVPHTAFGLARSVPGSTPTPTGPIGTG